VGGHSAQPATATAIPPAKAPAKRSPFTAGSGAKGHAGAGCRQHQLVRRLRAHCLDEVIAATVHRDDDVRVECLDLRHDLTDVLGRGRPEMEAAYQSVDFANA